MFPAGRASKYSKSPSGLEIENVSRADRGVYICRARVANTGQMEERKIEVEVSQASHPGVYILTTSQPILKLLKLFPQTPNISLKKRQFYPNSYLEINLRISQ